jgi:two-component SAPR family response regulator
LLLTDVMLPGKLNGPELAKQAVAFHPNLKVLFNSGYAEHAIMQNGLLDDGVHLIGKPFLKRQLANKIAEVLKVI